MAAVTVSRILRILSATIFIGKLTPHSLFGGDFAPDPAGEAYSDPPDPIAGLKV